ncbi:MAG: DUF4249 family protein [Chitinivibrionales bacterium]|nr:DUF4249 family protein [Chitinivibrionales bacterium]
MYWLFGIVVIALLSGCTNLTDDEMIKEEMRKVVVQGFATSDQIMDDFRLYKQFPIDDTTSNKSKIIKDAAVRLIMDGQQVECTADTTGRYKSAIALVANSKIDLSVVYNGKEARTSIVMPPKIASIATGLPNDSLILKQKFDLATVRADLAMGVEGQKKYPMIDVKIDEEVQGEYFYLTRLRKISNNRDTSFFTDNSQRALLRTAILSGLSENKDFSFSMFNLSNCGKYRLYVYRIAKIYKEYLLSTNIDIEDIDFVVAPSNIENGLGIFTGMAIDTSKVVSVVYKP